MWPAHVCPRLEHEEGAVLRYSEETSSVHRRGSFSPSSGRLHPEVWTSAIIHRLPGDVRVSLGSVFVLKTLNLKLWKAPLDWTC